MSFVMREFAVCACCQDTMWYTVVACRPDRRLRCWWNSVVFTAYS